jgi:prophage regulatory protein
MDEKPDRFLRIEEVLKRTSLRRSTLYRRIEQGRFPKQVPLSDRCVGWRESAVERWLANPIFYKEAAHI